MAKTPSVKSLIKELESDELREVIVELCKLNPKNRQFLQFHIQSSIEVDVESITDEAKDKIYSQLYGRSMFPKIDLRGARQVIQEYSKLLKDYPRQVAELQLYYVETGTDITNEFGDIDERFYSSMESMFASFCKHINKHPVHFNTFRGRLINLEAACEGIGWGYSDIMGDMIYDLVEAFDTDI
ncbi:hypothetical protein BH23BAC3_BH23BAC3_36180 [soil metagenome]